ncbi:MAG: potassium-transporting ATPase subunit KdpA, partial [Nitrospira sp.]|nr:potassium-transporting ATPase subunit KdpA [Nitrospira sp.]
MSSPASWIQLTTFVGLLAAITAPLGAYLVQVLQFNGRTRLEPVLRPLERLTYRCLGVRPEVEQSWMEYTRSMLGFSGTTLIFSYLILRLQHLLPLNPQGFGPLSAHLAFNTAASFTTNTNWQSYGGESTMSYLSQMVALTLHNFVSAAVGIAIAAALVRGIARTTCRTVGNFWADLVRITYYLLLPLCLPLAVFLISQGMIQNFRPYTQARLMEPIAIKGEAKDTHGNPRLEPDGSPQMEFRPITVQVIAQGPMASQVAIKMLGTNGGGFFNANAAHPFENPTPLSNFVQMLTIFAIGSGLTSYLGRTTGSKAHGWAVWAAMMILFVSGVIVCASAEVAGNPVHHALGVEPSDGNMEGKEVRFGPFASALFATITTAASCGAVNAMHDSFTGLGGLIPLFNMELGEIVVGGVGAGLYGMLVFVILAVFIAGLMVGRTPEYLGKKIEAYEVKMAMIALLVLSVSILGFTAWAAVRPWGQSGPNDAGPHGFSEILYAFSSATANNGSAFAGLTANTAWYNTTLGLA